MPGRPPINPRQVKTVADARAIVLERDLTHVKVGVFDIDGILRGKYMSRAKFDSSLDGGFGFCDVVLGWDSKDQLYDNVRYTGWHTGYPDATVRIIPESCRALGGAGGLLPCRVHRGRGKDLSARLAPPRVGPCAPHGI
jgi:glutamine synthetase